MNGIDSKGVSAEILIDIDVRLIHTIHHKPCSELSNQGRAQRTSPALLPCLAHLIAAVHRFYNAFFIGAFTFKAHRHVALGAQVVPVGCGAG